MATCKITDSCGPFITDSLPDTTGIEDRYSNFNNEHFTCIINSFEPLTSALPNMFSHLQSQLFLAIFTVLTAALAAYFFNHLHWISVRNKEKINNITSSTENLITSLEHEAVLYWLRSSKDIGATKSKAYEINLKSTLTSIRKHLIVISSKLNKKRHRRSLQLLNQWGSSIYDDVTGSDFESIQKEPDDVRASKIAKKCANMKSELISLSMQV